MLPTFQNQEVLLTYSQTVIGKVCVCMCYKEQTEIQTKKNLPSSRYLYKESHEKQGPQGKATTPIKQQNMSTHLHLPVNGYHTVVPYVQV